MKQLSIFFTACIAIAFTACSSKKSKTTEEQVKPGDAPTEVQKVVKTPRHIKLPNSNLYIIPPPGFKADELTATITTEEGHPDILVMKIISGTTSEKIFSDFKAQSDKDFPGSWKEEEVLISGHTAKIYTSKTKFGSQYYLGFTDGYTDEMIVVNYDETEMAIAKQLYEALKTVVVEK